MARRVNIRLPRRRWARRGRSLADFTVGFLLTAVAYLFLALIGVCGYLVRQVNKVVQRCRTTGNYKAISGAVNVYAPSSDAPSEKPETERDAVDVMVALGLPRRASERQVAQIVDKHGALPIEELLGKALG